MAKKRSYEEIENIDEVNGPISSTQVHGAIISLSPVKRGRKSVFFDGMLADESSKIRLVGFDAQQQRKLNEYHQNNIPVQLLNCEVKPSRQGEGYKLMLKNGTQIKQSPKKMDIASLMVDAAAKVVTLDELDGLEVFDRATVNVKVVELKEEMQVGGKSKRDIIIADGSGTARVSVWEGHVNTMEENTSYCLKDFMVREFQSTKYLTMAKEGSRIIAIDDIGGVVEQTKEDEELLLIQNVSIVGIPYLDTYKSCLKCKARVEPQTPPLRKCSKADCMMLQRYDLCTEHTSAKLMLMYDDEGERKSVQAYAYGEVVRQIAGCGDLSAEGLLKRGDFASMTLMREKYIIKDVIE